MITRTSCEIEKENEEFYKSVYNKNKRRTICKQCSKKRKLTEQYKLSQKAYAKNRRENNSQLKEKERLGQINRGMTLKGRSNRLYHSAKQRALATNLKFELFEARIEFALIIGRCERTGIPFDLSSPKGRRINPFAPSIDKIDPFEEYTLDNIQIVCNAYNIGKN